MIDGFDDVCDATQVNGFQVLHMATAATMSQSVYLEPKIRGHDLSLACKGKGTIICICSLSRLRVSLACTNGSLEKTPPKLFLEFVNDPLFLSPKIHNFA